MVDYIKWKWHFNIMYVIDMMRERNLISERKAFKWSDTHFIKGTKAYLRYMEDKKEEIPDAVVEGYMKLGKTLHEIANRH